MDQICDSWSIREKLALTSAVSAEGKNWKSVGERIKPLLEESRPSDWNSPENCAFQYNSIVETICTSKKKRGLSVEDSNEVAVKKLRSERIEELRLTTDRAKNAYMKLKEQIEALQDGLQNHRLQEIWAEITREKQLKQEKDQARMKTLEERERRLKEIVGIKVEETAIIEEFVETPDITSVDEKPVMTLQDHVENDEVVELVTEEVEIAPTEYEISIEGNDYALPVDASMSELEIPAEEVVSQELSERIEEEPIEVQVAQEEVPFPVQEVESEPTEDQIAVAFNLLEDSNPDFNFKTPPSSPKEVPPAEAEMVEQAPSSPELTEPQPTQIKEEEVQETETLIRTPSPKKASPKKGQLLTKKVTSPVKEDIEPEPALELKVSPKKGSPKKRSGRRSSEAESESEQAVPSDVEENVDIMVAEPASVEARKSQSPVKVSPKKKADDETLRDGVEQEGEPEAEEAETVEEKSLVPASEVQVLGEKREIKEETPSEAELPKNEVQVETMERPSSLETVCEEESRDDRDLKVWRKSILLVWKDLCLHKNSSIFMKPISDEKVKGYSAAVKRPMDLSTIKKNIDSGAITTTTEFYRDVMLMFTNAMMFNSCQSNIYAMALDMQKDAMEIIQNYIHTQLILQADEAKSPPPEKESPPAPPQPSTSKKAKKVPAVSTLQSTPDTKRRRTTRNSENL